MKQLRGKNTVIISITQASPVPVWLPDWDRHYKVQLLLSGGWLWHRRAVNSPRCVPKAVISCTCSGVQKSLLLWAKVARMASQKHINSSTTSTKPGAENKLTLSLSLPPRFTLTFACMHKQSQSHTHTRARTHSYTSVHTQICYLGMYMT